MGAITRFGKNQKSYRTNCTTNWTNVKIIKNQDINDVKKFYFSKNVTIRIENLMKSFVDSFAYGLIVFHIGLIVRLIGQMLFK